MEDNKVQEVTDTAAATADGEKKSGSKKSSFVFDTLEMVLYALIAACMIFTFVARVATVDGESMIPTLHESDRLIITRVGYEPEQGDIVVIMPYEGGYEKALVKRVIAVGGDTVDIDFNSGDVTINGEVIDEPYLNERTYTSYDVSFPLTVPEGSVFVMGDNRNHSLDSRDSRVGFIDEDAIMGRVITRIYPLKAIEYK